MGAFSGHGDSPLHFACFSCRLSLVGGLLPEGAWRSLEHLFLSANQIGDAGANALIEMLTGSWDERLRGLSLYLDKNQIGDAGPSVGRIPLNKARMIDAARMIDTACISFQCACTVSACKSVC